MKKICFVIQRYGEEVNGGAELHCKLLIDHLKDYFNIEVITTKAKDYLTWKNEYANDIDYVDNIKVRRYPVKKERIMEDFAKLNGTFHSNILGNEENELNWLIEQGPYSPELIEALENKKDDYDFFVFFTYLYYTTVKGIEILKDKTIFIPTAHDEPYINMSILKKEFTEVKGIFYNTTEERRMVESIFNNQYVENRIGGIGVDIPDEINADELIKKHNLERYIIYAGRIDNSKKVEELFSYFINFKEHYDIDLKLVLIGKVGMEIPDRNDIVYAGFVSDKEKFGLFKNAIALVLPSQFESLSMVTLEAMSVKTPVIVNAKCEVVKQHCLISNAGLYYDNYLEFSEILNWFNNHEEELKIMGENGLKYVNENYRWETIVNRFIELTNNIC